MQAPPWFSLGCCQLHDDRCDFCVLVLLDLPLLQDGPLDFYLLSGDEAELRRRPRLRPKEAPDCRSCYDFSFTSSLSGNNVTMLVASNAGLSRRVVELSFQESLLQVPSCMERCFVRPVAFMAMALLLTLAVGGGFRLAQPLCRRTSGDEAWAPKMAQCQRPAKPREAWQTWILHGCIMTYPWNPWHKDPLDYGLRCVVHRFCKEVTSSDM